MSKHGRVKYGFPVIVFECISIYRILHFILTLHIVLFFYSLFLLYISFDTALNVGQYINMVTENDGHILPGLLSFAALLLIPVSISGYILFYRSKSKNKNMKLNMQLFIHLIFVGVLALLILFIAALCLNHSKLIHFSLSDGISAAMLKYGHDVMVKEQIDVLQIRFRCCGNKNFREWFNIPWMNGVLGVHSIENDGEFISDDAPFSCCSSTARGPCIHHGVLSPGVVYRYDPKHHTLNRSGCKSMLSEELKRTAHQVIYLLFGAAVFLAALFICERFIQTAHSVRGKLLIQGRSVHRHTSWFIGKLDIQNHVDKYQDTVPLVKNAKKTKRKVSSRQKVRHSRPPDTDEESPP